MTIPIILPPKPTKKHIAISVLRKMVKRTGDGYMLDFGNYYVTAKMEVFGFSDWHIRDSNGYFCVYRPSLFGGCVEDWVADTAYDFLTKEN